MKNKKNILITGANGFIGRNLFELLKPQPYFNLYRPSHGELDLLDEEAVRQYIGEHYIDIIVHCAIVGGPKDAIALKDIVYTNTRMFFNLTRNLDPAQLLISLGSGAEYDIRFYQPVMSETYFDTHVPIDDYGFSKYICSQYALESKKNIIILRLFGVFGKYERYDLRFISNAIVRKILGWPILIVKNTRFDYLFIDDLARIISYLISTDTIKRGIFNVCTSKPIDLVSIAQKINNIKSQGVAVQIHCEETGKEYSGDNTTLLSLLKDFHFTPLDEAIEALYTWYETHINDIDIVKLRQAEQYLYTTRTGEKI